MRTSAEDFQFAASAESRSCDCELDFSKWFVGFGRWPPIPNPALTCAPQEFACVTVCILCGGLAERGRVLPFMVFTFFWLTLVYCPLAMWAWGTNGWGFSWGVLDFAGMSPYFLRLCTESHLHDNQVAVRSRLALESAVSRIRWSSAVGANASF